MSWQFAEKSFQAPKIIFKYPKLIGQKSLSYGHLLKSQKTEVHIFETEPNFQVLLRRNSPPKKTFIHENLYHFLI